MISSDTMAVCPHVWYAWNCWYVQHVWYALEWRHVDMSGMREMSDRLGISSNEKIPIFLEWMTMLTACSVGIPFAWVIISQRRK